MGIGAVENSHQPASPKKQATVLLTLDPKTDCNTSTGLTQLGNRCSSTVKTIVVKQGSKTAQFRLKMDHRLAPRHGAHLIEHPFAII